MTNEDIIERLVEVSHETARKGLVIAGEGNTSARSSGSDTFWVKRSGCELAKVTRKDFVQVDIELAVKNLSKAQEAVVRRSDEKHRASIESAMHACIYSKQSDVNFVIHTHSPYALGGCCSSSPKSFFSPQFPDSVVYLGEPERNWVFLDYARPGEEVASLLEQRLREIENLRVVVLANHGILTVGETASEAMARAEMVEKQSLVRVVSSIWGEPKGLDPLEVEYIRGWESEKYRQRVMKERG